MAKISKELERILEIRKEEALLEILPMKQKDLVRYEALRAEIEALDVPSLKKEILRNYIFNFKKNEIIKQKEQDANREVEEFNKTLE